MAVRKHLSSDDVPLNTQAPGGLMRRLVLVLLGAVAGVAWLPMLGVIATLVTTAATGCQVDEATVHPCMVAGHDIGEVLGTGLLLVFVAGPALPIAIVASVVWVVVWRRRGS